MGLFEQLPYTNFSNLNLGELIKFINETLKKIEHMSLDIAAQNAAIAEFKNYVMNYLNNLDVEQDVKDYIDELIANNTIDSLVNKSWLNGKNIVWYGDSWGTTTNNVVDTFITKYPNVNITNRCIGGTLMSRTNIAGFEYNSGYQRITSAADLSDFDYIFIMYGVNDWQQSIPLKTDVYDEYEYLYCVEETIKYLQTTFPSCVPVFIFQSYCYEAFNSSDLNGINRAGVNQPGYINNAIDICEKYNVNYINLFELMGVTRYNYTNFMRLDGSVYVHPKQALSNRIADYIFNGRINTGRCYGDKWSRDCSTTIINFTNQATVADYETVIDGFPNYPRSIVPCNGSNMIYSPVNTSTVIHVRGYKATNDLLGIFVLTKDGSDPVAQTGITNVTKKSLMDFYIEIDYHDQYAIHFARTAEGTETIYGIDIRFKNGNDNVCGDVLTPSVVTGVNATISFANMNTVENGYQNFKGFLLTATANLNAFTDLVNMNIVYFANESYEFVGINTNTGEAYSMYLYNGKLRSRRPISSGATIFVMPQFVRVPQ